jgi:UDP-N-acetylglucosamine--N-acetylmuramyl-(pentapeptide) pyrophosphoryl-undecaprenol N-acetylglucosamine transferase
MGLKILIAAGGTGGHVYPGVAIAQEILGRGKEHSLLFVGTKAGMEATIVPREGLPFTTLEVQGLMGVSKLRALKTLALLPRSLWQAHKILKDFGPQVVVGMGGYVSGPLVLAARLAGIPTLLHEQNAIPGATIRWLAPLASRVAVSFPQTLGLLKGGQTMMTGNPIRLSLMDETSRITATQARTHFGLESRVFTLLVFGGSRGAESINRAALAAVKIWQQSDTPLQVLHITGERDFTRVEEEYQKLGATRGVVPTVKVLPYLHEMHWAYTAADLVLCRAGATTLAELTALGKASILVPFPHAINNHQEHNARLLAEGKAALMILNQDLGGENLARMVLELMADPAALEQMKENSRLLGRPLAAKIIVNMIEELGLNPKVLARGAQGRG